MISRHAARAHASEHVSVDDIPEPLRWPVICFLQNSQGVATLSKSDLLRAFLREHEMQELRNLPHNTLARVFKCSTSLVQRVTSEFRQGKTEVQLGRPSIITDANMQAMVEWLRQRTENQEWIITREFKKRVIDMLEAQGTERYPSNQFYRDLLASIDDARYTTTLAEPLEAARFGLTQDPVLESFEHLASLGICEIDPHLIVNLDETGSPQSRSHRMKPVKVIVRKDTRIRPCVSYEPDRVFISAIAAITAAGEA